MNTSTDHAERARNGIHAAALLSLAHHMAEHQLPPPQDIYRPVDVAGWVVDLTRDAVNPWLATVYVDDEHNTEVRPLVKGQEPYVRSQWEVRLPAGTRLTITARRVYPLSVDRAGRAS